MGLPLRLSHSLGDRQYDLEPRPAERPIVVGCAQHADVCVCSSRVEDAHCFLYVDDGRWVVQDAGTPGGTYRNGQPVAGPTPLNRGDVITLGRGAAAPTLLIPMRSGLRHPPRRPDAPPLAPGPQRPPTPPGQVISLFAPPPPSNEYADAQERRAAHGTAWDPVPPAAMPFYVPKPPGASSAMLTVSVALMVGILVSGGVWLWGAYQERQAGIKPQVVVRPAVEPPTRLIAQRPTTTRIAANAARDAMPLTARRARPAVEAPPAPDPRRNDPDWQAVELARSDEPVIAIVKFYDYLERFPNSPFRSDVDRFLDEAADRIWWRRVAELFEERDLAAREMAERKKELGAGADPELMKSLEADVVRWTDRRSRAEATIRDDMNYKGTSPPNPYDTAALTTLRAQRDAAYYAKWKTDVLAAIQRSKGQRLPWRDSR